MPNYIRYSPWEDAANVGKGIGDALAAALFKVPEQAAEERRKNRQLDIEQQHYSGMEKYYNSLVDVKNLHEQLLGQYRQNQLAASDAKFQAQTQHQQDVLEEAKRFHSGLMDYHTGKLGLEEQGMGVRRDNADTQRGFLSLATENMLRSQGLSGDVPVFPPNMQTKRYEPPQAPAPAPEKPGVFKQLGDRISNAWQQFNTGAAPQSTNVLDQIAGGQAVRSPYRFDVTPGAEQPEGLHAPDQIPANPYRFQIQPGVDEDTKHLLAPEVMQELYSHPNDQNMAVDHGQQFGLTPTQYQGMASDAPPATGIKEGRMYPNRNDTPPYATHQVLLQDENTGRYFWTDELGAKLHVGKGFRKVD